ncbi:hypothetical protein QJS04_geneDACA022538 [Acorus gramineus]|uniref:Uncharacterized protein n=1 Tax=Acorus gramineus TaxID=55184 RepID=A0AAV9A8X9_ACOGR|nr:hypothetical protein QJS04_geneDACA022538 [Acorus gramineus]
MMMKKSTVMGGLREGYEQQQKQHQVRPIPKRGQVKMAILANVAHAMMTLFTAARRSVHLTH